MSPVQDTLPEDPDITFFVDLSMQFITQKDTLYSKSLDPFSPAQEAELHVLAKPVSYKKSVYLYR